jgi:hypothetical protein
MGEGEPVPNLGAESVAVIDTVPYHNVKINKTPKSNSTKKDCGSSYKKRIFHLLMTL